MTVTPATHPALPWRRLQGGPFQYPWIIFAVTGPKASTARAHVYVYSERNGKAWDRPCSAPEATEANPLGAARWALWFAQHHGG